MGASMLIARAIEQDRLAEAAEARLLARACRRRSDRLTRKDGPRPRFQRVGACARIALAALAAAVVGISFG